MTTIAPAFSPIGPWLFPLLAAVLAAFVRMRRPVDLGHPDNVEERIGTFTRSVRSRARIRRWLK